MFNNAKVYIAGHTGLLGSALLRILSGNTNLILRDYKDLDIANQEQVNIFFKNEKPDFVFLSTDISGGILANKTFPTKYLQLNLAIQNSIFKASCEYGVKKLLFYGSSCIYPEKSKQPIKEEYLMSGKLEHFSMPYAIAKIAGIAACKAYNEELRQKRFIVLVPNTVYGPGDNFDLDNSHVLAAILRKIHEAKVRCERKVILWGTGSPRREFIFSSDIADASIFALINSERLVDTHYNIGTGRDFSIKEVAMLISDVVGYSGNIEWDHSKPDGAARKLLDSKKFNSLGWKPKVTLEEGLKITYDWYLKSISN